MKHIHGFLKTQPLWKKNQFGLQQFEMPPIDIATFKSKPIPNNLRLGHQVEYIFKQLIKHSGAYEVLAHNIQVKKGNTTIGELDFILRDLSDTSVIKSEIEPQENYYSKKRKLLHLELTYKFYVIDSNISDPVAHLVGPNQKDSFVSKLEKTRDKQMPLIFSPEGKKALTALGIQTEDLLQQTYFVGQLFTPYGKQCPDIKPLNTACMVGFWIHFDQFNTEEFRRDQFYIPHKYEWLQEPHHEVTWIEHGAIVKHIQRLHNNDRAPMVWIRRANSNLEKCFVVWW